jgi:hypothetical protein
LFNASRVVEGIPLESMSISQPGNSFISSH